MDFAQMLVDAFMVVTGCTGLACCAYGLSGLLKARAEKSPHVAEPTSGRAVTVHS
jgi:hypothetical protein